MLLHRSLSVIADTAETLAKGFKRQPVTIEEVTDEEGGPPRRIPSLSSPVHRDSNRASPESEQRDSVIGNAAAESTAQGALREETQFHSLRSDSSSVGTSRFSRNSQSIQRVLREHAERTEARAQSAYERNRTALDLISKSMDNVRGAFTEARRARDRFHDMLSVSARSRESIGRNIEADSFSVRRPGKETAEDLRKVANYQRRVRSQVLGPDERRELQPSPVSSWRLRSGMYPASQSRLVEGQNESMNLGTDISTVRNTLSGISRDMDVHRMGVREWVAHQRSEKPLRPMSDLSDSVPRRTASPVARVDEVLARYNPVITPSPSPSPAPAPKRTAGERVSWLDRLNHPSTSRAGLARAGLYIGIWSLGLRCNCFDITHYSITSRSALRPCPRLHSLRSRPSAYRQSHQQTNPHAHSYSIGAQRRGRHHNGRGAYQHQTCNHARDPTTTSQYMPVSRLQLPLGHR